MIWLMRLRNGSISYSSDRIVVRYRFNARPFVVVLTIGLGFLVRGGVDLAESGFLLVLLAVGLVVDRVAVSLVADGRGVRIVNYGAVTSFRWPDVTSIHLVPLWARTMPSTNPYRLEIGDQSGRRARALVATSSSMNGYTHEQLVELVQRLEALRDRELGVEPSAMTVAPAAGTSPMS
jgi:hypothetical protein